MRVDLFSGGNRIVASGNAFLFGESQELTIKATDSDGFDICVTLRFLTDECGERRVKREISDTGLLLSCFNFGGSGTGLSRPTHIADANGKKVFLMFWMYEEGLKEYKARSVKYTLFHEL